MAKKQSKNTKKVSPVFQKMNKKFMVAALLVLFAGIGAYFVFASRAATNVVSNVPTAPALYIAPQAQTLGKNETFTVEIRANSGTNTVNAVQANVSYPVALVDYVPTTAEVASDNPNGISFIGSAFSLNAQATVDTSTGQVTIARGASGGTTVTGDKLVAKLTFKTKTTGGNVGINFTTGSALVSSTTYKDILVGSTGAGLVNGSFAIDTTGPNVNITAPANSANIELGANQTISATASDAASSVTKVEFYIDNVLKGTDTSSPYNYSWSTGSVAEGSHAIVAKAYDTYSNVGTSSTVTVTVKDTTAPTVNITAPAQNAALLGTVTVSANASDNSGGKGVAKVEFYVDGKIVGTDTSSPYSISWDTTTVSDANHSITAKAYDASSTANSKTSAAVTVSVDNSDKVAPTTPGNLRATSVDYTTATIAWDASSDNVGVAGYKLSRNGTQIYNGTSLSFNDSNLAEATTYSYSVVAYDAQGNVSAATDVQVTTKTRVTGDINNDQVVNVYDLSILLTNWNTTNAQCDLTKDGIVDIYDLSMLLSNWTI